MESLKEMFNKYMNILSVPEPEIDDCYKYIRPKYNKQNGEFTETISVDYKRIIRKGTFTKVRWTIKKKGSRPVYAGVYHKCGPGCFDMKWYVPYTVEMCRRYAMYKPLDIKVGQEHTEEVVIKFKKQGIYAIVFGALADKRVCGTADHMGVCTYMPVWDSYIHAVVVVI